MKKSTPTEIPYHEKHFYHSFVMKFFSIIGVLLLSGLFLFSGISTGNAEEGSTVFCPDGNCGLTQGAKVVQSELDESGVIQDGNVKSTIISVIEYFLKFIGIILVIIIIYSGFKLIFSQGEDDAVESAKKTIIYALIGVVVIVLSYTIVQFITGIANDTKTNINSENTNNQGAGGAGGARGEENIPTGTSNEEKTIDDKGEEIIKTINSLQDIVNEGGKIQESDITEIQNQIAEIFNNAPHSEELIQNEKNIQDTLEEIKSNQEIIDKIKEDIKTNQNIIDTLNAELILDPNNAELQERIKRKEVEQAALKEALKKRQSIQQNLLTQLNTSITQFFRTVSKIPEIRARISYRYSARTVPVTISLSGDQSYIIQKTHINQTLKNNDYYWYIIDPNGKKIELGKKMNTYFEIPEQQSGRYTFYLEVTMRDKNGKAISFPGRTQFSFVALDPETQVSFIATGEKKSGSQIEYTEDENKNGITFIPHVNPKKSRKIVLYKWRFDSRTFETREEKAINFSFNSNGVHTVSLTVIDNARVKTTITNKVLIKKAVAYFSLKKELYNIGETVFFSGNKSKTVAGHIVEYKWEIVDKNNTPIYSSEDKEFNTSFQEPGKYNASLTVVDNKGISASHSVVFTVESKAPKGIFSIQEPQKGFPALREFDASKSFDYSDSPLTYSWDFNTDGIFEKEDIINPIITYTYPEARKYIATLRVKNKFGKETQVQKNITIRSTLSAAISVSTDVAPVDTPITFTPSSHNGIAFQWDFGDGRVETSDKKDISHSFSKAGKHRVSLMVNNKNNEKITVYKNIFISERDTPTAVQKVLINNKKVEYTEDICGTGKSGFTVLRSDKISFSGSDSLNRDGSNQNLQYIWNFPDNTVSKKESVQWIFPEISQDKCFEVSLQVKDIHTNKKSSYESLYFRVENSLPSISGFFIKEPSRNISPVSIPLSVKANDKDGKIVKYSWWATQVGDNQTKVGLHSTTENKTVLIIPRTGEEGDKQQYIFHVEVEDNSGGKVLSDDELSESESIATKTAVDKSPKVSLSQDKKIIKMGDTVVFTAEAQNWGNQDITDEATFRWDFNGDNIFDDSDSGAIVSHKYKEFGNFIPRVKVIYKGLATSKEGAVKVEKTEVFPRAAFLFKKTANIDKNTIQFSSKHSAFDTTVTGNALKYEWDFDTSVDSDGDGNSKNDVDSTQKNPEFSYPKEQKSATVFLRVFDSVGGTDTVSHRVKFSEISGILGSFSGNFDTDISRIWLGENGENGKGIHLQFDTITGKWKNIGDPEFFFNSETNEWVKSITNANGERERIAFAFDENEQKWYDSSSEEQPKGLKLVYDEMLRKWVNIGDPAFTFNDETGKWEKHDKNGNIIPESEYKNTKGGTQNNTTETWEETIERLGNKINESLRFLTSTTATKLDLYGGEKEMMLNEKFQIFAFIKNLDGSLYEGPVHFSIEKGEGIFSQEITQSTSGRASTWFTSHSIGPIVIKVQTPETISHEISETLRYQILDNE